MVKRARRARRLWLVVPLVAALAGGAYYYYSLTRQQTAATAGQSTMQTTRARTGDLVISATAAGTAVSARSLSLGFATEGELLELFVAAGDRVNQGDPLARIDDLSARMAVASSEKALTSAQTVLAQAQQDLADLTNPASVDVLEAQAAVATAQEALSQLKSGPTAAELAAAEAAVASAQVAYDTLLAKPDADTLTEARLSLEKSKNSLWSAQMSRDAQGGRGTDNAAYDAAQVSVLNAEISVQQAEMSYAAAQKPATAAELQNARATLLKAQEALVDLRRSPTAAELASAEAKLARAHDSVALAAAQATVRQAELTLEEAQLALEQAQSNLTNTILTAPIKGTITKLSAEVGDLVGGSSGSGNTIITLEDLTTPLVEVYLGESDLGSLVVGHEADLVFDALPDELFTGKVTQVDPTLTVVSNMSVRRGVITLDPESFAKPQGLMVGMNATVDIIGGRAENAVLVPVEALRDLGDGQYAVFVVENGEPRLRPVTVGLQDYTYAEITSGLTVGEVVSTGITEVSR
jgi:multidrug efflux pump subunit AcrA (membrane-fusion protein)